MNFINAFKNNLFNSCGSTLNWQIVNGVKDLAISRGDFSFLYKNSFEAGIGWLLASATYRTVRPYFNNYLNKNGSSNENILKIVCLAFSYLAANEINKNINKISFLPHDLLPLALLIGLFLGKASAHQNPQWEFIPKIF